MRVGDKFGKWTFEGNKKLVNKHYYGDFVCECGTRKTARLDGIKSGRSSSCGCAKKNALGMDSATYERLYNVWSNMMKRCYNPSSDRYYTYGARGISVCNEWKSDFRQFAKWAKQNGWLPKLSIERKDTDGNYCPENCTFLTRKEQMRNKTNNVFLTIDGETKCFVEWCEVFGVRYGTSWRRYKQLGITDVNLIFYPGDLRETRPDILQFSLDGELIASYQRLSDAVSASDASPDAIRRGCQGKTKNPTRFRWECGAMET